MHEVTPPSGHSLHVTFGIHLLTVADLAHRALRLAAEEMEGLRAPVGHATHLQAPADELLAADLAAALSSRRLARALEAYRGECRAPTAWAPAEHWFGAHRHPVDGFARLGAAIAERVRNRVGLRTVAAQPRQSPTSRLRPCCNAAHGELVAAPWNPVPIPANTDGGPGHGQPRACDTIGAMPFPLVRTADAR